MISLGKLRSGLVRRRLRPADKQTLHQKQGETRTDATAKREHDPEALQTSALDGQLADAALWPRGKVSLARDQLLRVVQMVICFGADLIYLGWFQNDDYGTQNALRKALRP